MGAHGVGFVDLGAGAAIGFDFPNDLFQIAHEFGAARMDGDADVAEVAFESGIDAIDAVAHERIDLVYVKGQFDLTFVMREELADEGPISDGGGGVIGMTTGVTVNSEREGTLVSRYAFMFRRQPIEKGFAGLSRIRVFENDLIEDVDHIFDALNEEHAQGIDVEIEGPGERAHGIEGDGLDVGVAIERIVDAAMTDAGELGLIFLKECLGIELLGG